VSRETNPLYHDLIAAFEERTGVPVVINTSFNTRGKPIVCTPRDALECFFTSPLDVLALGPFMLEKGVS
jgi:carbamoyltransferase